MTPFTDPRWDIQACYITQIDGDPCIYSKHMIFPKPGTDFSTADLPLRAFAGRFAPDIAPRAEVVS